MSIELRSSGFKANHHYINQHFISAMKYLFGYSMVGNMIGIVFRAHRMVMSDNCPFILRKQFADNNIQRRSDLIEISGCGIMAGFDPVYSFDIYTSGLLSQYSLAPSAFSAQIS